MDWKDIIHNVRIYDLNESLIAAGYPMRTKIQNMDEPFQKNDWERALSLTKAVKNDNQAHGQFLTGIRVSFDLTFTNKAWVEAEKYRFLEFVSSQSTMHCITKFDIDNQYIKYTDKRMIEIMKELIAKYNETPSSENYLKVLYSNPCGFKITARMTTNYRCLMNIYQQRKSHRLPEWRAFCDWIESLPYSELITGEGV